ncbi:hypothetical protein IT412_05370 [Candidatus Peregrinibacteria bacterium]|nr:hypothetical protein [Candidatus Peregrinibacteria bacterium]
MTREEYLQILEKSVTFKSLDLSLQKQISGATGEEMKSYAQAFLEEGDFVAKAYDQLVQETDQIVADFKEVVVKDKKAKLVKAESSQHSREMSGAENLLNNL